MIETPISHAFASSTIPKILYLASVCNKMTTPTHISSSAQFEKILSTFKVVVVDFYADCE